MTSELMTSSQTRPTQHVSAGLVATLLVTVMGLAVSIFTSSTPATAAVPIATTANISTDANNNDKMVIAPAPAPATAATSTPAVATPKSDQAYVFWAFFTANSNEDWQPSVKGPAAVKPADHTFVGYRWGTGQGELPRATTDFDKVCAKTTAGANQKLIGVAIDPGSPKPGNPSDIVTTCVAADQNANALQILQTAGQVRLGPDNVMVCGINGFPATGCSYPASENPALATGESSTESPAAVVEQVNSNSSGSIVPILIIVGIIAVLIALMVVLIKSRNKHPDSPNNYK